MTKEYEAGNLCTELNHQYAGLCVHPLKSILMNWEYGQAK